MTSTLFLIALAGALLLTVLGAIFWRKIYRDDPHNSVRRVFKNSAIPFLMRMIVRGLDMAFFIILIRTLPGADIGPYVLAVILVGQYLGTFTEFGLGVLLTREVAQDAAAAPRLFGVTLSLRWLLVLVAAVPAALLLIGSYQWLHHIGIGEAITPTGQQAIWVLLLTLIPGAYSGAVTALYNAAERMEVPALIEVVTAVLGVIARVTALWLGLGILGVSWAAVIVTTITALIYLFLQIRDFFRPVLRWDWPLMQGLALMAFPLMLNNLLNAVFFRFDTFMIKAFGGGQGDLLVTQYDIAYKVISIAMILPPVVTFAVFPMLARRATGERVGMAQAQNRTLQILLWLAFPLAMGMTILATGLVLLINGPEQAVQYLPVSAIVLMILAWFLPLSFVNGLLQYVLIAINRQGAITRAFVIAAGFNLAANLIAMPVATYALNAPHLGLYAASVITILTEIVLLAVFLPLLRHEALMPPLLRLAWRPALAALLMGVLMQAALWLPGAWGWIVAVVLALPAYVGALWWLGAFGAEERALAQRILGRA